MLSAHELSLMFDNNVCCSVFSLPDYSILKETGMGKIDILVDDFSHLAIAQRAYPSRLTDHRIGCLVEIATKLKALVLDEIDFVYDAFDY